MEKIKAEELRLISLIYDINNDIIQKSLNSKLPIFIVYLQEKINRNKIIKVINKYIKNIDNYSLFFTKNELVELIEKLRSNAIVVGEEFEVIKNISYCKYIKFITHIYKEDNTYIGSSISNTINILELDLDVDNISCIIKIDLADKSDYFDIDYKIKEDNGSISSYSTRNNILYHDYNKDTIKSIEKINKALFHDMFNYIKGVLCQYNRKDEIIKRIEIRRNNNEKREV